MIPAILSLGALVFLASCGFLFRRKTPAAKTAGPQLKVLNGPDKGACFNITPARQLIGRQETADLRLHDPRGVLKLSREHAYVWAEQGQVLIADNHATHGVVVNGTRIQDTATLKNGDRLKLGAVELTYCAPTPDWWQTVSLPQAPPPAASAPEIRRATKIKPRSGAEVKPPAEDTGAVRRTKVKPGRGT